MDDQIYMICKLCGGTGFLDGVGEECECYTNNGYLPTGLISVGKKYESLIKEQFDFIKMLEDRIELLERVMKRSIDKLEKLDANK